MPDAVDDDPTSGPDGEVLYADDDPDAWIRCPGCGSDDARLKTYTNERSDGSTYQERSLECPDCGRQVV